MIFPPKNLRGLPDQIVAVVHQLDPKVSNMVYVFSNICMKFFEIKEENTDKKSRRPFKVMLLCGILDLAQYQNTLGPTCGPD